MLLPYTTWFPHILDSESLKTGVFHPSLITKTNVQSYAVTQEINYLTAEISYLNNTGGVD